MKSNKMARYVRFLIYFVELCVFYCLEQLPSLTFEQFNARPMFLVSAFVCIIVWEKEFASMAFGIICGAFLDVSFGLSMGICMLIFGVLGYCLGVISNYFVSSRFWTAFIICVVLNASVLAFRFFFGFFLKGYSDCSLAVRTVFVPTFVYSVVAAPLIFLINRSVRYFVGSNSGGEENRLQDCQ